ncbi:MAG: hypothetical protein H6729_05745 [Deltaproteobacteria bacterium]|nr:hypothetical protein [Deltaproteobacteria bacterium]
MYWFLGLALTLVWGCSSADVSTDGQAGADAWSEGVGTDANTAHDAHIANDASAGDDASSAGDDASSAADDAGSAAGDASSTADDASGSADDASGSADDAGSAEGADAGAGVDAADNNGSADGGPVQDDASTRADASVGLDSGGADSSGADSGWDPGPDPSPATPLSDGFVIPANKMGVHDQPRLGGIQSQTQLAARWDRLSSVVGRSYGQYNIWWSALEPREGVSTYGETVNFCPQGVLVPRSPEEKARFGYNRYHCYSRTEVERFDKWLSLDYERGVQSGAVIWSSPSFVREPACEGFPWAGTVLKDGCVPRDAYMDDFEDYVRFLGRRYNGFTALSNGKTAKLSHFIIWNEAASSDWTDLSPLAPRNSRDPNHIALRIQKYAELMRRAHAALKSVTFGVMMYASTDHLWEDDGSFPAGHMGTRRLLEGLWSELGTSISWSVAVHPYGEPSSLLPGRYTFRNLNLVSDFQRAKLAALGISSPSLQYPQPYLIASEQGGWSIGDAVGKARAICEAHAQALGNDDLILVAHNYFHQASWDPDNQTFGLVPRSVNDDLANLLDTPEGRAFAATAPAEWARTGQHECCRAYGVGCSGGGATGVHPMDRAESNDVLPGWDAARVIDGQKLGPVYSTDIFPSASNTRGSYLAAWVRSSSAVAVSTVRLYPRMSGSSALAFPVRYEIALTSSDNTQWVSLGTFTAQPSAGVVQIDVRSGGAPRMTFGVLIRPIQLGQDDFAHYYFQLDELELVP